MGASAGEAGRSWAAAEHCKDPAVPGLVQDAFLALKPILSSASRPMICATSSEE
jgi:hypothetical protein